MDDDERIAALAVRCFRTDGRNFSANGALLSSLDFAVYAYEQSVMIVSSGSNRVTPVDRAKAMAAGRLLSAMLEVMLDDIEKRPFSSIQDVDIKWGSRLRSFDRPRFSIFQFVSSELGKCFVNARVQVERDKKDPATEEGQKTAATSQGQ